MQHYSLDVYQRKRMTHLIMKCGCVYLTTKDMPKTTEVLWSEVPSIFASVCFNEQQLPFAEEVLHTEVGHLYEHILLEELTLLSDTLPVKVYRGVTSWNWNREPLGHFHIRINVTAEERLLLVSAIQKSDEIMNRVFEAQNSYFQSFLVREN